MHQLSNHTISKRNAYPIRIMQFGGGNFLRAFADWMIEELNEKTAFNGTVAVVKPTERGTYKALRQQDGLFHVILNGVKEGNFFTQKKLITCVQQVVHPYQEWEAYLKLAENPELRFIISNTTEAGIAFNNTDTYDACPPHEFPAKLTRWLYHRFEYFAGDNSKTCIFLPLELVAQNGDLLKKCMLQYAELWKLGQDFKNWINAQTFCNTLVDRIVSGFPKEKAAHLQKKLGVKDDLMVVGEYYHSWIIEAPKPIQKELPFSATDLNVKFVDDLDIHRKIKVRILNGAHTSMVSVGYLAGARTVLEVMENTAVHSFIEKELLEEILPILDFREKEKQAFTQDVLNRFRNPALQHQLLDIALNSTSKFVSRLLPSLIDYYQNFEKIPPRIAFVLAALIRFYKGTWKGEKIPLKDAPERLVYFNKIWTQYGESLEKLSAEVLGNSDLWGMDLTEINGLKEMVTHYLVKINNDFNLSEIKFNSNLIIV